MSDRARRLLELWTRPLPAGDAAVAAFRELYADEVRINGLAFGIETLVERARALQRTFSELEMEPIDEIELSDKLILVFKQRGRLIGPLETPLGDVHALGRVIERQVIDVLTLEAGRIVDVRMTAEELGPLAALDVLKLK